MAGFEISSGKPGRLVVKFEYSEAGAAVESGGQVLDHPGYA